MSDAPAAPVTENGVPPVAQEAVEEAPGFKVFVGNLAYSITDDGLKTLFEPFNSDVLTAQVIMRGTKSAGYGFVSMSTAEAAQKAVESLDKKELEGRPVIVEIAKPAEQKDQEKKERRAKRRPGRRGSKAVPGEVSEAEANGDAPKADATEGAGDVAKPKKKKKSAKRKPKRKSEGADAAADGEGAATDAAAGTGDAPAQKKQPRKPRAKRPPRPAGEDPVGEPSQTMLFVANLGFNIDEAELRQLFTDAGISVESSRIIRMKWGHPRKSRGFGFVGVTSEEEQKKAIEALNGKKVGEREIAVKVAVNVPRDDDEEAAPTSTEAAAPAPVAA